MLHFGFLMVREFSDEQPLRASRPRLVTFSDRSRELSPEQRRKAPLLMEVTVLGMLMDLRLVHSAKAPGPIFVIPSPMTTELMELLDLYHGVSLAISHEVIFPVPVIVSLPPLSS